MTKWYLYEDDEVIGPLGEDQLRERLDEETLVCEAGEEDWRVAGDVPELESLMSEPEPEDPARSTTPDSDSPPASDDSTRSTDSKRQDGNTKTIEPTLEELQSICERADNDELLEQYEEHWDDYDAEERRLILAEIDNRGLMD